MFIKDLKGKIWNTNFIETIRMNNEQDIIVVVDKDEKTLLSHYELNTNIDLVEQQFGRIVKLHLGNGAVITALEGKEEEALSQYNIERIMQIYKELWEAIKQNKSYEIPVLDNTNV